MSRLEELLLTWHEGDLDAEQVEDLKTALKDREGRAALFEHFFMTAVVADAFRSQRGTAAEPKAKKRSISLRVAAAAACLIAAVGLMLFRSGRGTVEPLPAILLEGPGVGVVLSDVSGVVIHRAGKEIPCGENTSVYEHDRMETSTASRALMYFRDGTSRIFLREDTSVEIDGGADRKTLRLERGILNVAVLPGSGADMILRSRHAEIAVTGTRFEVRAVGERTSVKTYEGSVRIRKPGTESWTDVPAGRTATAAADGTLSVGAPEPAAKAGTLVRAFDLPEEMEQPSSSAHDGLVLWVCDRIRNVLYKLDDTDGRVLGSLAVPDAGRWPNLAGWDGRSLWTMNYGGTLCEVDPATGRVRRTIPPVYPTPDWQLCSATMGEKGLWVIARSRTDKRQKLWIVSPMTGKVTDTRELSARLWLIRTAYLNGALWTRRTTVIYKMDPENGKVLKQFGGPMIHHGDVSSDGVGSLWNVTGSKRKAYLVDTGERPWKK